MVIVLAVKLPDIRGVLDRTDFFALITQRKTSYPPRETIPPAIKPIPAPPAAGMPSLPAQSPKQVKPSPDVQPSLQSQPAVQTAAIRTGILFFVKIEEDGLISSKEVRRNIPASESPLTDNLGALIQGPNEGEIRSGLVSLIPRGTKILGVKIQGNTAIVNLSEAFMYNQYGPEGYEAQLKQLVYTATSFPSIHDVQVLIEGQKKEYLGGEGVYIGASLSRNSF
ncbi:MAG: sporulation/spore germination protein [Spirochaetes bacterium]|nr:MAG: sporulation/spore germination protein [Spirochaetota bacterium]